MWSSDLTVALEKLSLGTSTCHVAISFVTKCFMCDDLCYRSDEQISLDSWHELRVTRTAKSGILQVDSQRAVEGISEVLL